MAALITGDDVAEYLGLDAEENGADYEEFALAADVWIKAYHTVPVDDTVMVLAAKMLASRLAKRKSTPEGIGGIVDGSVYYVSRTDPDIAALLAPYRNSAFA